MWITMDWYVGRWRSREILKVSSDWIGCESGWQDGGGHNVTWNVAVRGGFFSKASVTARQWPLCGHQDFGIWNINVCLKHRNDPQWSSSPCIVTRNRRNRHAAVVLLLDSSTPFQPPWQELVEMAIQKMTAWQSYRCTGWAQSHERNWLVKCWWNTELYP